MELKGSVVVITGANGGIGRSMAAAFGKRGASLALLDISVDRAELPTASVMPGASMRRYECDVADEDSVNSTFNLLVSEFGRLDILINNAGIIRDALLVKAENGKVIGRMTLDQWKKVIDVNLTGSFLCAREAAARMIDFGNGGLVVNISSVSRHGNYGQSNYSAAKAGVDALTTVWARELARFGIRVASIAPGFTKTPMTGSMSEETLDRVTRQIPLRRLAQPEEIAKAAVFIAENDYLTGRCIEIDGGLRL